MRAVVTGAHGRLGGRLAEALRQRGHDVVAPGRAELDISDGDAVDAIADWRPDVVVNAAAWTDVDGCARDPARARKLNRDGAELVARAAARTRASVIQVSTNEVFAGDLDRAYREDDRLGPVNPYGESKQLGELAVRAANPRHLIVRTAWLFGGDRPDFVTKILAAAERASAAGEPLRAVADEWGNPTSVEELASRLAVVAERRIEAPVISTLHLCGEPPASRYEWAQHVIRNAKVDVDVVPVPSRDFARSSTPPLRAMLDTGLAASLGLPEMGWAAETARYVDRLRAGATFPS